ncbi:MAG: hypothetical protein HY922_09690 [Elusimicrobia bacterium]|nr:hypothetical protein [Elusimicrobiota bacterium]
MSKKHRKKGIVEAKDQAPAPEAGGEILSTRSWKVIGVGIFTLALGFYILTFTDPLGGNWASRLSPFLILGAYGIIAAGILLPKEVPPSAAPIAQTAKENPPAPNPGG